MGRDWTADEWAEVAHGHLRNLYAARHRLEAIAELAHQAANGGLDTAAHKATAGELKAVLRQIRDMSKEGNK